MGSVAWLFPGQGSQSVGMSRELAERYPSAMHTFDEASHALGIDLKAMAWEGTAADLDLTASDFLACPEIDGRKRRQDGR